ncbi:MAG: hypothetical protein ACYTCV_05835 [Planctomycetota bacterium]|jgi:ketosteroid isomerase-like protein
MKDSRKYSPKIKKLFASLKRKSAKHTMPKYTDPIDAVVYALVSEHVTEPVSGRIYKRMMKHFVNLNDLRVSRREEILDVFGDSFEAADNLAASISRVLNTIFEKKNTVSLAALGQEGKRQAHKELSEIEGITPFAVSYCFLTAMDGHAIPLNAAMLQYLRHGQMVHPGATDAEIAGFLERQVAAADAYNFYMLLRQETEQTKPRSRTKSPAAKKKTAAKKKVTAKKKTTTKKKLAVKKKKTTVKKKVTAKKKVAKK